MKKTNKNSFTITKQYEYAYHPELSKNGPLHESTLYFLADADAEEVKSWGLFLVGEKIDVKDHE